MKVALNTKNQNQSIKSIRCTFCEISIEFYSTSTEAPFEKTIIINNYFYYYDIALRGLINSP
jgi:C4-type Zn-finger protein